MTRELSAHVALWRTLVAFPKYITGWTAGLIVAILGDLYITTYAVTGVAVGFAAHSVLIGVATFFLVYSYARTQTISRR